jgi:predicted transcriptional regulator
MNRLEMIILAILKNNKANSQISAISLYEIKDYANLTQSVATIYRAIQQLYDKQYLQKGLKDSKSHTFYITQLGESIIEGGFNQC